MIQKQKKFCYLFILFLVFQGCSDSPSNSLISDEFDVIDKNLKSYLGEDYAAVNFVIIKKEYLNVQKNEFFVEFTFDLNKPVFGYEAKNINGKLIFRKQNSDWKCVENTANLMGILRLGGNR